MEGGGKGILGVWQVGSFSIASIWEREAGTGHWPCGGNQCVVGRALHPRSRQAPDLMDLVGQVKELVVHFKRNGKPQEGYKQMINMI